MAKGSFRIDFISVSNLNTIDSDHLILCYGGILGGRCCAGVFCEGIVGGILWF